MSQTSQQSSEINAAVSQVEKKKVIAPPTWFNLVPINSYHVLSNIGYLTNGFRDLPQEVADWIIMDAQSRPFSSYGSIPAPPSNDLVKQIIGIDGYYLKLTTQKCGVDFIWHDRVRNEFQFWGEYHSCVNAMKAIRYRICKYVEGNKPAEKIVKSNTDIDAEPAVWCEATVALDVSGNYMRTIETKFAQAHID